MITKKGVGKTPRATSYCLEVQCSSLDNYQFVSLHRIDCCRNSLQPLSSFSFNRLQPFLFQFSSYFSLALSFFIHSFIWCYHPVSSLLLKFGDERRQYLVEENQKKLMDFIELGLGFLQSRFWAHNPTLDPLRCRNLEINPGHRKPKRQFAQKGTNICIHLSVLCERF